MDNIIPGMYLVCVKDLLLGVDETEEYEILEGDVGEVLEIKADCYLITTPGNYVMDSAWIPLEQLQQHFKVIVEEAI